MDLPVVEHSKQKRPSLKADPISELIRGSSCQEQALYVLLAATGMRISEALELETKHFINNGRTRSEEHTSELQSHHDLVCRPLLEKKRKKKKKNKNDKQKKKNKEVV